MEWTIMERDFFERDTVTVAKDLLGCSLVRRVNGEELVVRINETEAYTGRDDPASHAFRGVTPRNRVMFGPGGVLYMYFIYGMHTCMNIVTDPSGTPGAVLIRGAEPVKGIDAIRRLRPKARRDKELMDGPGKLVQALAMGLEWNGYDLTRPDTGLLLLREEGNSVEYQTTPRIGISRGKEMLRRFVMLREQS